MKRPRIYISGPISKGDPQRNFISAENAHRELIDAGFAPLNPVLTMTLRFADEIAHETWIDVDLPWVASSDAILRLPGESVGADMETAYAREIGVPVYVDIADLIADREAIQSTDSAMIFSVLAQPAHKTYRIVRAGLALVAKLVRKNLDYGNSAHTPPCLAPEVPVEAAIRVRASDKVARLQNLLRGNTAYVAESIDDTLDDLAGYLILHAAAKGLDNDNS